MTKRMLFALPFIITSFPFSAFADESLCARVRIEVRQELTLERQAFDAHMRIKNDLSHITLENVDIDVNFTDEEGSSVPASSDPDNTDALFFIRLDSISNIGDIDGSGTVQPSSTADIHWLIIPAPGSSNGLEQGTLYYVGARLTYTIGGEEHVTEVSPDYIFVKPMPELTLDYFLPKNVYGDDAFTPDEIEPPIPFPLGVRVNNNGAGVARNVKIDSAQPEIVENELGLLIGFVIEGSEVNGEETTDSLLVEFGDIDPSRCGVARWIMTCSLSGKFIEFTAKLSHSNELGGELTSLIDAVNTHFLVRDVLIDIPGRDTIRDFLAKDGTTYKVYESECLDTEVLDQSASSSLSGSGYEYILTTPATAGFMYVQLPDPLSGQEDLVSVVRSDGKVIKEANAWLSKTRDENDHTKWNYFINLFDVNTTDSYTFLFAEIVGGNHPPVLQFIPDRQGVEEQQLSFIVEASDSDGTVPTLSATPLPDGADFTDQGNGIGVFDWTPIIGQAGVYDITFTASDGELSDAQIVRITICPANDTDNDCMDDDWELEHFGTLDRDGTGDFDGDGVSDRDEFLNGTDPTVSEEQLISITPSPIEIELAKNETDSRTLTVTNLTEDAITYEILCPAMATVLSDPEGDLIPETSGSPSVDIIGADVGFTDDMQWMRLRLAFASAVVPELTGSIYFDTDQDASTGLPAMEDYYGAGAIGYEYLLNFSNAGADGTVIIEDAAGGDPVVITGVFGSGDTEFTIDIPLTAIGNDDGNINLGMLLSNTESQLDVAPESDYATLSGNGTFISWLAFSKTSGVINPGASDELTASFDADGLEEGQYSDEVVFRTLGAIQTQVTVPVILTVSSLDSDSDGVADDVDNCPDTPNGPLLGTCSEGTYKGDPCTVAEGNTIECGDNGFCSMDQEDTDQDDIGDVCDNCPADANFDQSDNDSDGVGNVCDNCWEVANPDQLDSNGNCSFPPYSLDPICGDVCEGGPTCGNGIKEGDEVCDGGDLGGEDCSNQGFDGGTLACLNDCSGFDFSNCTECGNDTIEGTEACDGSDLGGETCETQGYSGGALACLSDCSGFDVSGCVVGDLDGDGVMDDVDNCPDTPNGPLKGTCFEGNTGDECLSDDECGGIPDSCSMDQEDEDIDDIGDVCDNCSNDYNPEQFDNDSDAIGNLCDNCWEVPNVDQIDTDADCIEPSFFDDPVCGDPCDTDIDEDGILDDGDDSGVKWDNYCVDGNKLNCDDNCPFHVNPTQNDYDEDGIGDECEEYKGDVNDDGMINVLDIQRMINILLKSTFPPTLKELYIDLQSHINPPTLKELWTADMNSDQKIDVSDIQMAVNKFLWL